MRVIKPPRPAAIVLAALTLAGWGAAGPPADGDGTRRDVVSGRADAGLPATVVTGRGLDLQPLDRSRTGSGGQHGPPAARLRRSAPASGHAALRLPAPPAGSAQRALARAGRLASPATGPPVLS